MKVSKCFFSPEFKYLMRDDSAVFYAKTDLFSVINFNFNIFANFHGYLPFELQYSH